MESRERVETRVGLGVLVGAAIIALAAFGLSRVLGEGNRPLLVPVRFANAAGLQGGNAVRVAGVKVGRVTGLRLVGDSVEVTLAVAPRFRPHTDADALITAAGFSGGVYVAYDPGTAPRLLPPGQAVAGRRGVAGGGQIGALAENLRSAAELASKAREQFGPDLDSLIEAGERAARTFNAQPFETASTDARAALASVRSSAAHIMSLRRAVDTLALSPDSAKALARHVSAVLNKLDTLRARPAIREALNKDSGLAADLRRTRACLHEFMRGMFRPYEPGACSDSSAKRKVQSAKGK